MELESLATIIAYLETIPEDRGCVDERSNDSGQHCVLGHLDRCMPAGQMADYVIRRVLASLPDPILANLAAVNNGTFDEDGKPAYCAGYYSKERDISGLAIKTRVLKYLRSFQ